MARYGTDSKITKDHIIYGAAAIIIVALIVLLSFYPTPEKKITNFEECIDAGYPAMESYPRQCAVPNGTTFTENITIDINDSIVDTNVTDIDCVEEGRIPGASDQSKPEGCCEGLVAVPNIDEVCDEDGGKCECMDVSKPGSSICTDCGDGACGEFENVCNCAEDCVEDEPIEPDCVDSCGDGTCQDKELCEGEDCPCLESLTTCTEDCSDFANGYFVSKDSEVCSTIRYICADGEETFSDEEGCGCKLMYVDEFGRHYCTDEQKTSEICIAEFDPVCGWFDSEVIKCVTYPCAVEYSNSCNACKENVSYWTEGVCPLPGSE